MIHIKGRNTIQKTWILTTVLGRSDHPTADEVYADVLHHCPTISRATVYRVLNQLASDGDVRRIAIPDGADRFDRVMIDHSHFRCLRCSAVQDMDVPAPLTEASQELDGGVITGCELFFIGYCKKCREDAKNGHKGIL